MVQQMVADKSVSQLAYDYRIKAINLGVGSAEGVDAIMHAIFYATKDESKTEHDMLMDLSTLSGMSCTALRNYRDMLTSAPPSPEQLEAMAQRLFVADCKIHDDMYTMGRARSDKPRGYKTEVMVWNALAYVALTK